MNYLLDTNAFVDHMRNGPASKVTIRLLATPASSVYLCSVVLAELVFGAVRSGVAQEANNRTKISGLVRVFPSLPFDHHAAEEYGKLRAMLMKIGTPIGPNHLLITAIALAHGATIVTHNTTEFSRVPNLIVEDWR